MKIDALREGNDRRATRIAGRVSTVVTTTRTSPPYSIFVTPKSWTALVDDGGDHLVGGDGEFAMLPSPPDLLVFVHNNSPGCHVFVEGWFCVEICHELLRVVLWPSPVKRHFLPLLIGNRLKGAQGSP